MTKTPDLFEWVTGFRAFRVGPFGELLSQYADYRWRPGVNVASCLPQHFTFSQFTYSRPHEVPDKNCRCGLHVHYDPQVSSEMTRMPSGDGGGVIGLVRCAGQIVPHHDGFRAERAEVCAIFDPHGRPMLEKYRTAPTLEALKELAPEYGAPFPIAKRPPAPDDAVLKYAFIGHARDLTFKIDIEDDDIYDAFKYGRTDVRET